MRMKVIIITMAAASLFAVWTHSAGGDEPSGAIEYSRESGKLWGIKEIRANDDGSVTLFDAIHSGYGYALSMRDADHAPVDMTTLKPKAACTLSDGHHVFLTYKFLGIQGEALVFKITERVDARSFGGDVSEKSGIVTASEYADEDRKPPENPDESVDAQQASPGRGIVHVIRRRGASTTPASAVHR